MTGSPISAFASSIEPCAATRMWNFGNRAPSANAVRPSSPTRVVTLSILIMVIHLRALGGWISRANAESQDTYPYSWCKPCLHRK